MSRQTSPVQDVYRDKKLAKTICRTIYYCGLGDCWYEPMRKSRTNQCLYVIWSVVLNFFLVSVVVSQLLAFTVELTPAEMNDNLQLCSGCSFILLKLLTVYCKRNKIKGVLKKLLEDTRISLTARTEVAVVKKARKLSLVLAMTMWLCVGSATMDAIRLSYKNGIPFRTLVTLWPRGPDVGFFANVTRFIIQVHWWYLTTTMVICDSLCIIAFILLSYKFRTLQMYFTGLRKELLRNDTGKTQVELEEDYKKSFKFGVKLHGETLWCARHIQSALGEIYSIQVVQSISLLSVCLIKLATQERSATMLVANLSFISVMLVLTGIYMMAAGDITHEASLVSTAIFNSGWELCKAGQGERIKLLLVLAIQRGQEPVIMTAFGIYNLSYANFISVLRSSYSFFTVTY